MREREWRRGKKRGWGVEMKEGTEAGRGKRMGSESRSGRLGKGERERG